MRNFDESPRVSGCKTEESAFTLMTAKSANGSVPTIFAEYDSPLWNVTVIFVAFLTTWLFVIMWPVRSYTIPDPRSRLLEVSFDVWAIIWTTPSSVFAKRSARDIPEFLGKIWSK